MWVPNQRPGRIWRPEEFAGMCGDKGRGKEGGKGTPNRRESDPNYNAETDGIRAAHVVDHHNDEFIDRMILHRNDRWY